MGTRTHTQFHDNLEIPETKAEHIAKKAALFATAAFFAFTGLRHLLIPEFYQILMPSFLPVPLFLIYVTGAYQIVCAIGLLFVNTRKMAAWGLMGFLLATLPILVYMWVYKDPIPSSWAPSWLKMLSIPLQFALMFWVYQFSHKPKNY
ncbi:MAG: hypothetical protein WC635_09695 [Bacteriovorax sp.]|jgi:uncharacterized membrane protein